jgi:3-methyladenine DNA glycosylase AlkD
VSGSAAGSELDPERVAGHLHVQLAEFGSPQRAAAERSYLKSRLRHLGAPVPAVRRVVRNWERGHPQVGHDDLFAIADALWAEPVHERRLAAIELLQVVPRRISADDMPWMERHLRECGTWALVDPLAGLVVADLLPREPAVLSVLDGWVADDDFWMRRSAVLGLRSAVRRGEHLDVLFDFAERLLPDTEFFVRKAIGWVLREVAPRHPREVSAWLREHVDEIGLVTLREPLRKLADGDEIRALYDARRNPAG